MLDIPGSEASGLVTLRTVTDTIGPWNVRQVYMLEEALPLVDVQRNKSNVLPDVLASILTRTTNDGSNAEEKWGAEAVETE
eukprot:1951367-Amphidinium_carterae.1